MEEEIADEKQESENNSNDDIKDSIKLEQNNAEEASNESAEGEESKDVKCETNEAAETKPDIKNESSSSTFDPTELVKEPLFAEICSFFNMFAAYLNMKPLSFVKLEKMFCTNDDEEVSHDLIDLHLTLLRKIGYKSARFDKWESFLQKFLLFNKDEEKSVQLERLGYANLPLTTKLEVLFQLCGRQFDFNIKFKENIFNTLSPFELRFATIGKDRNGLSYWYQRDHDLNVRVYTEEPEDESGSTWSLIARSHNDIIKLIASLKRTDFGQTKDDNDEDVDESQILDCSTDSKKSQTNGTKKKGEELLSPNFWKLLKPEVAEKYYKYLAKRNTFKDVYRDGSDLNKRKNEKLQKKEAKANGTPAATSSQTPAAAASTTTPKIVKAKSEEKEKEEEKEEEEEPEIPQELLEDRRILPRRSARSNAITSIKSITSTPARKKAAAAAVVPPVEEKKKEESEEESSDDGDEVDEDEEESDRSFGRSDEEFSLPSKKGKGGKATKKPRKQRPDNDDGDTPPKPKKKKKKVETIAFEESSDEEEEQQEIKEKRKATALTLCIHCHKSSKQDVLLLCDMCDDACHTFCLKPPLHYVPDDDWFCPQCHHAMLVDRLVKVEEELKDALKVKEAEDSKKMQAAERLKREMEYIGVSLNNIIPSSNAIKQDPYQSMTESTESEDDGQRKSKKKAMKKVMKHTRKKEREQYYGPVVTVAEGRSRRSTKKVDYNFSAYDEQLQEAMDVIDEPGVKTKYENDHRPAGGLGRGKDMATIEDAQRKRSNDSEDFEDENDEPVKKKKKQKSKKLTDLDIDNATESEDDEYRASENEEEEDAEPSEDDYVPSDIERQSKRRGRQRSDAEFIDDDESDEEYNPSGRKKKGKQVLRRSGGRKKRKAWDSDEEESEPEYQDESSDDGYRKKRKKAAAPPPKKRSKKDYSDEEEDEEVEDYQGESSDSGPKKKTARGRPMRKAAAKAVLKESDDEELGELDDAEEGTANDKKKNESRPIGALSRKLEEDEFKPDEDDEEEEEEEEEAEVDENDDEVEDGESDEAPDTGEEDEESRPPKIPLNLKRKAPTPPSATAKKSPSKTKKGNKIVESPKEEKPTIEPKKEISPPVKAATPASNPPSSSSTPKPAPTPPRQQILIAPNPQQASHLIQPQQSSPGPNPMHIRPPLPPNGFLPYSTAMPIQQHPNAIRFIQPPPHSLYGSPAGGYYGPPPMNYGPPPISQHLPILPTYVMQNVQPLQYGMPPQSHGFLPSNLTMLEPLQPMHHHIPSSHHQQSNNMYGGLQPIQHSQPSDSDGLAQAIAGAMNSEL